MVNNTSQNKKTNPVIAIPGQRNLQLLANATLLSKDNITGKIMVNILMSKVGVLHAIKLLIVDEDFFARPACIS